ncbi:conserved hypothetical protein [Thermosulfidibacter takaii ABI70S6]|uniref:WSC domain-containing protein n=1 Tax=Thermosulfidibacter takaii (strain DSM 17441 / JCM 13301 / NBRC 103674 / ABI70S6) TaxID=1298851 RepID=A0A0S3QV33_THET7|nr:WSC domain-containing protein [Thermosulfidibacter takaii]BAT72175.1 conserved hypothetical protein [Thermosulfidibacter takaii ABI70S6]
MVKRVLVALLFFLLFPLCVRGVTGRYVGCFVDKPDRDLSAFSVEKSDMTVEKCVNLCSSKGYKYAALQFGRWCFCGNSYGRYGVSYLCNHPCAGKWSEICGGVWANSVYAVRPKSTSNYTVNKYLGCFRDKGDPKGLSGRDLNGFIFSSPSMTIYRCISLCADKGFKYAAVQYGSYCFCGNSYGKYGKAQNCNMLCSGNRKEICGGVWANSVYEAIIYDSSTAGENFY